MNRSNGSTVRYMKIRNRSKTIHLLGEEGAYLVSPKVMWAVSVL